MTDKEREDRENLDAAAAARRSLAPGALVAVTFLEMYAPYNAGETAGVDRDLAERLVKAGKAVYYGERREDPPVAGEAPGQPLDTSSGRDMAGAVVEEKDAKTHHGKGKR